MGFEERLVSAVDEAEFDALVALRQTARDAQAELEAAIQAMARSVAEGFDERNPDAAGILNGKALKQLIAKRIEQKARA